MDELTGNILITGGTGTLGQAIVRRAHAQQWHSTLTIYSRDELKQYEMKKVWPGARYVLGDIGDVSGLQRAMAGHDRVIHAAAQKHIPEGERNPGQTFETNVLGSLNVLYAAAQANVGEVILISTDKVCHAVNVYGATKLLMERCAQDFALSVYGRYVNVKLLRYGNVLGSNGSVLQVWERQARGGQALQLTDPEMTRFWITEDGAVDLILKAASTLSGHIYIPKLKSTTMRELKEALYPTCRHEVIGLRPGEKMHEEMLTEEERPYTREYPDHFELGPVTRDPIAGAGPAYTSANCQRYTAEEIRGMVGA